MLQKGWYTRRPAPRVKVKWSEVCVIGVWFARASIFVSNVKLKAIISIHCLRLEIPRKMKKSCSCPSSNSWVCKGPNESIPGSKEGVHRMRRLGPKVWWSTRSSAWVWENALFRVSRMLRTRTRSFLAKIRCISTYPVRKAQCLEMLSRVMTAPNKSCKSTCLKTTSLNAARAIVSLTSWWLARSTCKIWRPIAQWM